MKSLSFLIDTDWVIDHLNGVTHVSRRLKELQPQGLGLSVVSAAELWEGAYFSRDPKRSQETLEAFLSGVDTLGLDRSEEHTSELQSLAYLVCRLLLEKKKKKKTRTAAIQTFDTT